MKKQIVFFETVFIGLIPVLLFVIPLSLEACTAFSVKNNRQVLLAKNLDWEISNGIVLVNKRGVLKTAFSNQTEKLSWVSKYGSITFNQFGKEFPLGGMNEQGLTIEELNSWGETPKPGNKFELNEFQWTQYCLDNCATIEELLGVIDSIAIVPMFINLHYLATDKHGESVIIEFHNGQTYFYTGTDLPIPVLSNNHYKNSLKYLENFRGFGGEMEIPHENTSNERFVKVASMLDSNEQALVTVGYSFDILDAVRQEDTQWSIVYNISNQTIHFKSAKNNKVKIIALSTLDFSCNTPVLFYEINMNVDNIDTVHFNQLAPKDNSQLLLDVYNKYDQFDMGDASKQEFIKLSDYGNGIQCK
ncbi:MAG TPA: hypothetical protein DDX98_07305 [Bacteroidales bacterium]|jgi:penicillin V acylase-like amidase (Ntn superfamily)|nr:hypothetical protein [Bacteroidales bacterium]